MATYEIPTSPQPQTFTVALNGVTYTLLLKWNVSAQAWMLDISDAQGTPIATGIPLVPGLNLAGQLGYLDFAFDSLFASSDNDPAAVPTFSSPGSTGRLYAEL